MKIYEIPQMIIEWGYEYLYLIVKEKNYLLLKIDRALNFVQEKSSEMLYLDHYRKMILKKDLEQLDNICTIIDNEQFEKEFQQFVDEFIINGNDIYRYSIQCAAKTFENYLANELKEITIEQLLTHQEKSLREFAKKITIQQISELRNNPR